MKIMRFFLVTALAFSVAIQAACPRPNSCTNTNEKPVYDIYWDIHKTLIRPTNRFDAFWDANKWDAIKNMNWNQLRSYASLVTNWILGRGDVTGEQFYVVAIKNGNKPFADLIEHTANAQEPMPGMPEILEELKKNKQRQHIASNIGPTMFQALRKKTNLHDNIFTYFGFNRPTETAIITVNYATSNPLKKPDPKYFDQFTLGEKERMIFIDDSRTNVKAAEDAGIGHAILFKDADQLRKELAKLGIISATPPSSASAGK